MQDVGNNAMLINLWTLNVHDPVSEMEFPRDWYL